MRIIVNADDFGASEISTFGTIKIIELGGGN